MADLKWTEAQWEKVQNAITEAFGKANVATSFLPCYGPLADSAEYVRDEHFSDTGATVTVSDDRTLKLFNLTVTVKLSSEQVAEESLSTALLAFRRAANTLAQVEDDIVFNGFGVKPTYGAVNQLTAPRQAKILRRQQQERLANDVVQGKHKTSAALAIVNPATVPLVDDIQQQTDVGEALVNAVVKKLSELEDASHPEPFACILGTKLFEEAHRPVRNSMVLPADRITPILKGPLLRSGQMDSDTGIVVSLASNDIDLVIATPPKAQFLQVNGEAKYLFRVYTKFRLRLKDQDSGNADGTEQGVNSVPIAVPIDRAVRLLDLT
jgi:uncharacterized linocin/CFP29 family protein